MKVRILNISNYKEACKSIKSIGVNKYALNFMAPKTLIRNILISDVDNRAANIIKQECLSAGADAAVSEKVSRFELCASDVLLMATDRQLDKILQKFKVQPFGLKNLAEEIKTVLLNYDKTAFEIICCGKKIKTYKPLVMGILNITPDSFSDGGKYFNSESACIRAEEMCEEGADIIDVGGQSTRPGAKQISEKEETARVVPVIRKLSKKIKIPVSIDTYRASVAKAAIEEGAVIVNDIYACRYNKSEMLNVVKKYKPGIVLMHMQGRPSDMQNNPVYKNVIKEVLNFLDERVKALENSGVDKKSIILDPGIGFGKTLEHNLEIIKYMRSFKVLGLPVMAGVSLKSFIGKVLDKPLPQDRFAGTLAANIMCLINGASILRVHNVKETADALKIIKAVG